MPAISYARALLEHWGVTATAIPSSITQGKKEADFLASFEGTRVLIEEKTKEDAAEYLSRRGENLASGEIHAHSIPLRRSETMSGVVRNASKQLLSSSDKDHDFRLIWFTATGIHAEGEYEQFMSTLYGRANIFEKDAAGYRRCYYFRHADFFRRAAVLDGAIVAHTDGQKISARLCLNALSPRYEALKDSPVVRPFGTAVEDPLELESEGAAFVLDCDLDRKNEGPLLTYLQKKYSTGPLMKFDLGYLHASVLVARR